MLLAKNKEYLQLLHEIKIRVRSAQIKAAISVNKELIGLYWDVGRMIAERQAKGKWGDSIVDMLAGDLRREFPDMKGFSRANIFNIRQWYLYYSAMDEKVQQLVRQLPWGHNLAIIHKIKDSTEAVFYLAEAIRNNWSRNILIHQIESGLYQRKGKVLHNFEATLPAPQSDLARQMLKDPYVFDFLSLGEEAHEREIDQERLAKITKEIRDKLSCPNGEACCHVLNDKLTKDNVDIFLENAAKCPIVFNVLENAKEEFLEEIFAFENPTL